jgi:hypothetical protein
MDSARMDASGSQAATPKEAERRRHRRFPCEGHAEVVCCDPTVLFRGRIRDISLTGCFIETAVRLHLQRHTQVDVRFTIMGRHFKTIARVMEIRRGKGAGFEFLPRERSMQESFLKLLESLNEAVAAPLPAPEPVRSRWGSAIANSRQ